MTKNSNINIQEVIKGCLLNNEKARKQFYEYFASKVMSICRRYTYSKYEADDIFQESFINIFKGLKTFDEEKGAIEGWIYSVTVNAALKSIKKNYSEKYKTIEEANELNMGSVNLNDSLTANELLKFIDELPIGKKTIFNLYVIEGYTHKEIAEMLKITEGTSKSQLAKAKEILVQIHNKHYLIDEHKVFK